MSEISIPPPPPSRFAILVQWPPSPPWETTLLEVVRGDLPPNTHCAQKLAAHVLPPFANDVERLAVATMLADVASAAFAAGAGHGAGLALKKSEGTTP